MNLLMLIVLNTIAENLHSQIDSEESQIVLLEEVTDHNKDVTAVEQHVGFYTTNSGDKHSKRTRRGWKHYVEWNDGTTD